MLHVVCPEFRHEFIYVKNIVKLYKNSGVPRFQMVPGADQRCR